MAPILFLSLETNFVPQIKPFPITKPSQPSAKRIYQCIKLIKLLDVLK